MFRRGGLTSACGSAHVRNGRGCRRQTEAANTTLRTAKGCKNQSWLREGKARRTSQETQTLPFFVAVHTAATLHYVRRKAAVAAAAVDVSTTAATLLVRINKTTGSSSGNGSTTTSGKP